MSNSQLMQIGKEKTAIRSSWMKNVATAKRTDKAY